MRKSLVVILLVLLCDQLLKVWVKLNMTIGECVGVIGKWFNICLSKTTEWPSGGSCRHRLGEK